MDSTGRRLLGLYLFACIPILILLVAAVWPGAVGLVPTEGVSPDQLKRDREVALVWSVVLLGALGGSLHGLSSFATYVGNRNLVRSWVWWYTARTPIGGALALIVYLTIRGGLMGTGVSSSEDLNPYGIGALAFLSGLFSEVATEKLREVFLALFRPGDTKKDGLTDAGPTLTAMPQPASIRVNAGDTEITLIGDGFSPTDKVMLDGSELKTTFVSTTEVRGTIPNARLQTPATLKLNVRRAGPRGISSAEVEVQVVP